MHFSTKLAAAVCALGAIALTTPAAAQHHRHGGPRVSFGFSFGAPVYYAPPPYYYYPSYYYPPRVVVVPAEPTVYVERESAPIVQPQAQAQAPANYWYYCGASRAYYPYVRECPGGWEAVPPRPAQ